METSIEVKNELDLLSFKKKVELKCADIFQKIDEMGNTTHYSWFYNLNKQGLLKFINELLMRSQTSPLGLGPEERVIHQDYTSQLIKNTKIGNIIEDALKTINLSDLLEVPYWREVLNHLFSLDAKEGFLKFMSLLR